jgi:hypothetical protein
VGASNISLLASSFSPPQPLFEDGTSFADINQQQAEEKTIRHSRVLMICASGTGPICLVSLVYLVFWLNETNQMNQINQINKTNRKNQTDQMNKTGRWTFSVSCWGEVLHAHV